MTIYTRWGSEVEVLQNCGECQPEGFRASVTLLKVKFMQNMGTSLDNEGYYFMEFLKGTEGWIEIQRAVESAPNVTLSSDEYTQAFKEAM